MKRTLRAHGLQVLAPLAALLPLAWMAWAYWQGSFLVDPVLEITSRTGKTALILLLLSLSCTPLYVASGFRPLVRLRRRLGLYAFLYVGLHFLTFVGLDYGLDPALIMVAILEQRYVLAGIAAGLLLLLLAVTSTRGWQQRLGKLWGRLHRLVYLAVVLAVVHFAWSNKDIREPLRYGAAVAVLLLVRLPSVRRVLGYPRRRFKTKRALP